MPTPYAVRRLVRAAPSRRASAAIRLDNDERRAQLLALARKAFSRSLVRRRLDRRPRARGQDLEGPALSLLPDEARSVRRRACARSPTSWSQRVTSMPTDLRADRSRARRPRRLPRSHLAALRARSSRSCAAASARIPRSPSVVEGVRKRLTDTFLEQTPFAADARRRRAVSRPRCAAGSASSRARRSTGARTRGCRATSCASC